MKTGTYRCLFALVGVLGFVLTGSSATRYVAITNTTPASPYTNWATAACVIQDAVDAADPGDEIQVADGVYASGGRAVYGTMTNRVAIDKAVIVRSVSGPNLTRIVGQGVGSGGTNNGDGAMRCVYVGTNAVLSGFTLTNGHTRTTGDPEKEQGGGGAWCERSGALTNCTLIGNSADFCGGGAHSGTLNNCTLTGNAAIAGGGVSSGTLNNCTLTGNSASESGGGANACTLNNCTLTGNSAVRMGGGALGRLTNCIVYHNTAPNGPNYLYSSFTYSCTTPLPLGIGNIDAEPQLASATHLSAQSPCIGRGSPNYASGVDIDGEAWLNPPCMGADQFVAGDAFGELTVSIASAYTNVGTGFAVSFVAQNSGPITSSVWNFGDGVIISNRAYTSHAWAVPGLYEVQLTGYNDSFPGGVSATVLVRVTAQEVYYVNGANPTPAFPYTNWAGAATTIQEAIDAGTQIGRLVRVTNGVYASGGRAVFGTMTNRVVVAEGVELRSENGSLMTFIVGQASLVTTTNGDGAIRCAYVGRNAVLTGFTLTNGHTRTTGDPDKEQGGGGAWCEGSGVITNCTFTGNLARYYGGGASYGTLNNCTFTGNSVHGAGGGAYSGALNYCILSGNSAGGGGGTYDGTMNNCTFTGNSASSGGGAYSGTLNNCTLIGNSASSGGGISSGTLNNCTLIGNSASNSYGGGAEYSTLNNCTLTGNSAECGGGAYRGTLNNCIVYYNTARDDLNYSGSSFAYSCTTPLPAGTGNMDAEPLMASATHLSAQSPCIGRGSPDYASGVDIDSEAWLNPPCMGADQFVPEAVMGDLTASIVAAYTNARTGFAVSFAALISGRLTVSVWDFGDGVVISNRAYTSHAWAAPGLYEVRLTGYNDSFPGGVSATGLVRVAAQEVYYVKAANPTPLFPYTNWTGAARTIQEALDAGAQIGRLVRVTNGVYASGGRAVAGTMTNRVVVAEGAEVRSENGPLVTIIVGQGANGDSAIRCVYVGSNAVLSGFTLTNGHTRTGGYFKKEQNGGGAWCEFTGMLTNCTFTSNSAYSYGGGAYQGTLNNCALRGNSSYYDGGGASYGILNNCTITGNSAHDYGGGASESTLNNCILTGNSSRYGGGASSGTLNNCTLSGNSAVWYGGGSYYSTLNNCILYYNRATDGTNHYNSSLAYSCTTPLPAGMGNITNVPFFMDTNGWTNLRLQSNSSCINAGNNTNAAGPTDLDGNPRIAGGRVDMGAYEYQGANFSSFSSWLWQYGLRIDGSADFIDSDGDGLSNWQEWLSKTHPTNSQSVLRLFPPVPLATDIQLSWPSAAGVLYQLDYSTNLATPALFQPLSPVIPGETNMTSFYDTNAPSLFPRFYRVRVLEP